MEVAAVEEQDTGDGRAAEAVEGGHVSDAHPAWHHRILTGELGCFAGTPPTG